MTDRPLTSTWNLSLQTVLLIFDFPIVRRNMSATNGVNGHTNGTGQALCSVDELVSQKYDFVVVGAGTAGLAVAARLTEDPNISVAVLEAGENRMNDPKVSTPALYPTMVSCEPARC